MGAQGGESAAERGTAAELREAYRLAAAKLRELVEVQRRLGAPPGLLAELERFVESYEVAAGGGQ